MVLIKRNYRRILFSWTSLILAIVFSIIGIRGIIDMYSKESRSRERLISAENEHKEFEERYSSLNSAVKFLETDEGVEAELRRKYRAIKEGEQAVFILKDTTLNTSTSTDIQNRSWYTRLFEYFK